MGEGVVLELRAATSADWLPLALERFDEILIDHAHCEKKAAGTAMNLIFAYGSTSPAMSRELAEIVVEELEHFRLVLDLLERRGIRFTSQQPGRYGRKLNDLVRKGVQVIAPNPKTSGGARWNYLAAWGYELKQQLGDLALLKDSAAGQRVAAAQEKAKEFVARLYKNVPVLDSGARGSTNTFVKRGIGDVLLSWENEALLAKYRLKGDFDIVVPSISILAEPPVAVVDGNADKHGAGKVARAYLEYLYSPAGQKIAAANYYRPLHPEYADAKDLALLPKVPLFKLQDVFGDWRQVQKTHFADGGIFDQIYLK